MNISYPIKKLMSEPLLPIKGSWIDAFPLLLVFGILLLAAFLLARKTSFHEILRNLCRIMTAFIFVFFLFKCLCIVKLAAFGFSEIGKDDLISFSMLWLIAVVGSATFLFGRIFCGFLCPVGFLQEISGRFSPLKQSFTKKIYLSLLLILSSLLLYEVWPANEFAFEFVIAILSFIMVGIALLVQFRPDLEPALLKAKYPILAVYLFISVLGIYFSEVWCTLYGAEIDYSSIISLPLVILAALAVGMPYCRYVCPTGFFLALCSKTSLYSIHGNCIDCGMPCGKICPSGALFKGKIDPLLCISCGRCIKNCTAEYRRRDGKPDV